MFQILYLLGFTVGTGIVLGALKPYRQRQARVPALSSRSSRLFSKPWAPLITDHTTAPNIQGYQNGTLILRSTYIISYHTCCEQHGDVVQAGEP